MQLYIPLRAPCLQATVMLLRHARTCHPASRHPFLAACAHVGLHCQPKGIGPIDRDATWRLGLSKPTAFLDEASYSAGQWVPALPDRPAHPVCAARAVMRSPAKITFGRPQGRRALARMPLGVGRAVAAPWAVHARALAPAPSQLVLGKGRGRFLPALTFRPADRGVGSAARAAHAARHKAGRAARLPFAHLVRRQRAAARCRAPAAAIAWQTRM